MWLPKDERYLLMGYYVNICNINDRNVCRYLNNPKWFELSDWTDVLKKPHWIPILTPWLIKRAARKVKAYGEVGQTLKQEDKTIEQLKNDSTTFIKIERRHEIANNALKERRLIKIQKHKQSSNVVGISITIDGYDLGRKYCSWWKRSNLWYAEYIKHHWIWVIGSFASGIIATLLVWWLTKVLE